METCKVIKLIPKLRALVSTLEYQRDTLVHHQINQFYYMQKSEELNILIDQAEQARRKLETLNRLIDGNYKEVYWQWRKDVRWLNVHLRCPS